MPMSQKAWASVGKMLTLGATALSILLAFVQLAGMRKQPELSAVFEVREHFLTPPARIHIAELRAALDASAKGQVLPSPAPITESDKGPQSQRPGTRDRRDSMIGRASLQDIDRMMKTMTVDRNELPAVHVHVTNIGDTVARNARLFLPGQGAADIFFVRDSGRDIVATGVAWNRELKLGDIPPSESLTVVAWPLNSGLVDPFMNSLPGGTSGRFGNTAAIAYDGGTAKLRRVNYLTGWDADLIADYASLSSTKRAIFKAIGVVILIGSFALLRRRGYIVLRPSDD